MVRSAAEMAAEWFAPGSQKAVQFESAVKDAEKASLSGDPLPPSTLSALLEEPRYVLLGGSLPLAGRSYQQVELTWANMGTLASTCMMHEVSQSFERRLWMGRRKCYRLHRFSIEGGGDDMSASLASLALLRNASAFPEDDLYVSNVGGFHSSRDLFRRREQQAVMQLQSIISTCVRAAAAADKQEFVAVGETPPNSEPNSDDEVDIDDEGTDGWLNVSRRGDLNNLHHHSDAVMATVFYAQVPKDHTGGALLLRLTPGTGQGSAEPDEDLHVPRMWNCGAEIHGHVEEDGDVVMFAEVQPKSGTLLVFPGWLSHSVAPHFSDESRISVASNWDPRRRQVRYAESTTLSSKVIKGIRNTS